MDANPSDQSRAARVLTSPRAVARARVRAICRSIRCSTRQLNTAAEPATSAMPTVAATIRCKDRPSSGASSIPINAQKTTSETTRGLVSAR